MTLDSNVGAMLCYILNFACCLGLVLSIVFLVTEKENRFVKFHAVQSLFPDGVDATRFLRSHSSLGSEVSHVEETIEFVASLPAEDRISVVQATYETALLMASGRRLESSKSEAEIREELEEAAGAALLQFK